MNAHATPVDVVVVGAGIAGLSAANALRKRNLKVVVLEKAPRVGGRMETVDLQGHALDTGAQFLSSGYAVILSLLAEFKLHNQVKHIHGDARIRSDRGWHTLAAHRSTSPWRSGLLDFRTWARFGIHLRGTPGIMRRSLSDYSAWADLDHERAPAWLNRIETPSVTTRLLEPILQGFYFQTPEQTSRALATAVSTFALRKCKALAPMSGMGQLPERMADVLDVRVGIQVDGLEPAATGFRVIANEKSYLARGVIMAVPAPAARACLAPLEVCPSARALLETGYTSSITVGIIVGPSFKMPSALEGAYGLLISDSARQVIAAVGMESAKGRIHRQGTHCLNFMFSHEAARHHMDKDDATILESTLRDAGRWLSGLREACIDAHVRRWPWAEPLSDTGRSLQIAAYRQSCGTALPKVVLAGDYMSMPYTEGAAESGIWAAQQLASGIDAFGRDLRH